MAEASHSTSHSSKHEEWEVLDVPSLIQHSTTRKGSLQDTESVLHKSGRKEKEKLCGYLMKFGGGIMKAWKKRWFVYDHRRCLLHYYRKPLDSESLGNIDIANATFCFGSENKAVFQISSNDRIYQLEAPERNTMLFWLQELQSRRREYAKTNDNNPGSRPESGLLSEGGNATTEGDSDDETDGLNKPIDRPHTVGESTAVEDFGTSGTFNFSFSNINKEFKNWRKSTFLTATGEPILLDTTDQENLSQREQRSPKLPKNSPKMAKKSLQMNSKASVPESKSPDGVNRRKIDFGFSRMVANLKNSASSSVNKQITSLDKCQECVETHSILSVLQEAISVAEKEITTRDEVIESLNEQLRVESSKNQFSEKSADEEVSEEREHYILQLTRMVKKLTGDLNELKMAYEKRETALTELQDKEEIYKELVAQKDNTIISLTNQNFALENQCADVAQDVIEVVEENPTILNNNESGELDYTQLKEACTAYQTQNNFLNSEILELYKLRKSDMEKLTTATEKLEEQEVEYLKLKSRYFLLLKNSALPKQEGNLEAGVVEQLIDDAIKDKSDVKTKNNERTTEYRLSDKYGFYDEFDLSDTDALESIAGHLEVLVGDKENGSLEMSSGVKWENYLITQTNLPLVKTEELKSLTRMGIPHEFRARVWGDLVNLRISSERNMAGVGYYENLLKEKEGVYSPSTKQIELDLLRTLPNNKFYDTIESEGTSKLRRILMAYSWHNPAVGYCQGLNRLGAIALLYLDEEMAFWCLVAITEHLMPIDYYSRTLLGAQIDQRVFRDLLDEKCPKLSSHLNALQFDISLIAFNWFLTVFVDLFPIELTLRVWDTFLFEGSKVLFRYALAVFKLFEEDFLKFFDPGPMFNFFRTLPKARFNIHKICQIAFTTMNPFSRRNVESKRNYYRPILQNQLDKFEIMRQEYREKRDDSISSKEDIVSDDEN